MKKCNVPKHAATKHGSNMWLAKQGVQNMKNIKIDVSKNQKYCVNKISGKGKKVNQSTRKQKPKIKKITLKNKTKNI